MLDEENKNDVGQIKIEKEDVEGRVYELGYLLVPTLSEENISASYTALKDLIVSLSSEIISDEMPKILNLAYPMQKMTANIRSKFDTAYFGWIKFEMNRDKVLNLKKKLSLDPNIIRFLILKTIRDNTIAAKRFIHKDYKRKTFKVMKEAEEISLPMDKEKVDKEIDALVAV